MSTSQFNLPAPKPTRPQAQDFTIFQRYFANMILEIQGYILHARKLTKQDRSAGEIRRIDSWLAMLVAWRVEAQELHYKLGTLEREMQGFLANVTELEDTEEGGSDS